MGVLTAAHGIGVILAILLGAAMIHTLRGFLKSGKWRRKDLLELFAKHEVATYAYSVVCASALFGFWASMVLLLVPFVWFVLFNKTLYSASLTPSV